MPTGYARSRGQYFYVCPLKKCGRSWHLAYYSSTQEAEAALEAHLEVCRQSATPNIFKGRNESIGT